MQKEGKSDRRDTHLFAGLQGLLAGRPGVGGGRVLRVGGGGGGGGQEGAVSAGHLPAAGHAVPVAVAAVAARAAVPAKPQGAVANAL